MGFPFFLLCLGVLVLPEELSLSLDPELEVEEPEEESLGGGSSGEGAEAVGGTADLGGCSPDFLPFPSVI